ncbi:MAG: hypothetical protein IJH65_16880 [Methanobrevibacter sp.]|nr:hypothetical protein [Methanobrevibacter sp.]
MTKKEMLDWILILNDYFDVTVWWVTEYAYMWTDLLTMDDDDLHSVWVWYWEEMYNAYKMEKEINE